MLEFLNNEIVASVIKSAIVIFVLLTAFAYMTLIERRVVARIQGRLGPNRLGPLGMFQPVADAIKMAFKEQIVPSQAKKAIYLVAPIISVVVALCAFAVVPIGNNWSANPAKPSVWDPIIGDVNIGLLWILSISSLAVYGIVLGGWASGNRYSLLGALRSAAQMVSYETSLGLALSGVARALGLGWTYLSPAQILAEIARTTPLYAGTSRRALGASGARWPLAPGERAAEGHPAVTGSAFLSWDMLSHGLAHRLAPAGAPGEELAISRGRGE